MVHSVRRDNLLRNLISFRERIQLSLNTVFPAGNVHRHGLVQRALIAFLQETVLADNL